MTTITLRGSLVAGGLVMATLALHAGSSPHESADKQTGWGQFRGPDVSGIIKDSELPGGPAEPNLRVAWKSPLGSGYSGISSSGQTLATMFSDGTSDVAAAFDAMTGRELWRFVIEPTLVGLDGSFNGPISTPLIMDDLVIGLGARGRLFALDLTTGRLVWSADMIKDHASIKPHYGYSTSPVFYDGNLVLQVGAKDAAVVGLDPRTGQVRWKAGSDEVAYQTPIPFELGSVHHLLFAGNEKLMGVDPGTGEVYWEYEHGGGHPRGAESMVPVSLGEGRYFIKYKANFSAMVTVRSKGGSLVAEQTWESRLLKNTYAVPVYYEGYLYGYNSRFLACVDALTGEGVWKSRPPGDGFPILWGDKLLILTKQGSLHVAKASAQGYQELSRVAVFDDLAWTPPGYHDGSLYVRSLGEIARVDFGGSEIVAAEGRRDSDEGTTRFAHFLRELRLSEQKSALLDSFLSEQTEFPIIEGDNVHFVYRGPGKDLALAGDMVGARQEVPMKRVDGTDFFHYTTQLARDARVSYLFMRDFEEIIDPRNPRKTSTAVYGKDMEVTAISGVMPMSWVSMPDWQEPDHYKKPGPGVARGTIEAHRIEVENSGGLPINVYLPAGYEEAEDRYPVLYVLDGQGALSRGQFANSLDNLISRSVQPLIAVFVMDAAGPSFSRLFGGQLVPFIDRKYRTTGDPRDRALLGGGGGGTGALFTTFLNAGVVGKIAVQTAMMLDTDLAQLQALVRTDEQQPLKIYVEWGQYDMFNPDEAWDMRQINRSLADFLRSRGYEVAGGEFPDGTGWSSWKNRSDRILKTLFPMQ